MHPQLIATAKRCLGAMVGVLVSACQSVGPGTNNAAGGAQALRADRTITPQGGPACVQTPATSEVCKVTVKFETLASGGQVCVASAPEVKVTFGVSNQPKRVAWVLNAPITINGSFRFNANPANLLVVAEKVQGHVGPCNGMGCAPNNDTSISRMIHRVNNSSGQRGDSTVLPVVIWKYKNANQEDVEDLCAAIDPRIVNQD